MLPVRFFGMRNSARGETVNDFLDCMELALKDIVAFPEMFPVSHATFRRALIRRFPFSIFYMIEKETIVVHAVFDNRQAPDKRPQTK